MTKISDIIRKLEEEKQIRGDIDVLGVTVRRGYRQYGDPQLSVRRHPNKLPGQAGALVVIVEGHHQSPEYEE